MKIEIDDYVLEQLFEHRPAGAVEQSDFLNNGAQEFDEYWYAPVLGGGEGWVVLWANGEHLHTYHDPAEWHR